MNNTSQTHLSNEENEILKREELMAIYADATPNYFDPQTTLEAASLAKRLDEVDLYTLALVNYFKNGKSGRNGLMASELKELIKKKGKLNFGERLLFTALGRLEIIGAIETKIAFSRMRVYLITPCGEGLDYVLYTVNKQYKDFVDQIEREFEFKIETT